MRTLILITLFAAFGACRQHDNSVQLREVSEGLRRANDIVTNSNEQIFHTLESRMADPQVIRLIEPWYPAAVRVHTLSREMQATIGRLDSLLDTHHEISSSAKNALFDSLVNYKKNILAAFDSALRVQNRVYITKDIQEINRQSKVLQGYTDSKRSFYAKKWKETVFGSSDPMIARLALNKIKNDVALEEHDWTHYLESITSWEPDVFYRYYPLVRIAPDYVKANQEIEVSAGVTGGYINLKRLEITIDSVRTPINDKDRALAVRTIKASNIPGRHTIPVTIEISFPNGCSNKVVEMVSYRVHE